MSSRFVKPRSPESQPLLAGDLVHQRLGLHRDEPNVRWVVVKVTVTSVKIMCCSRGRGSKMRGRVFSFSADQAASMLMRVSDGRDTADAA